MPEKAATEGATQVWGALVASTATTVVIFVPIMFLQDVSGQLFSDLALVISVAVIASLFIAVTVIPAAAGNWIRDSNQVDLHASWWDAATRKIMTVTDSDRRRKSLIGGLFVGATVLTWALLPPADYLPKGEQGWIFAFILMPPGQSVTAGKEEFADVVIERMDPYLDDEAELQLHNYFMGMFGSFAFAGGRTWSTPAIRMPSSTNSTAKYWPGSRTRWLSRRSGEYSIDWAVGQY